MDNKIGAIKHDGIINEITDSLIRVSITSKSACSDCHAKGFCSASEMAKKIIDIKKEDAEGYESGKCSYSAGDRVCISMEQSVGTRAVWIAYAVPVIILLFLLLSLQRFKLSELLAGLIVLAGIALYFFVLYLCRGRVGKKFRFRISKAED